MKVNVSGLFKMQNNRIFQVLCLALFCVLALSLSPLSSAQATEYVDAAGPGGIGSSWADAHTNIQDAIDTADAGEEIWVRQGTYNLGYQINVNKVVHIYGGFPLGGTPDWGDRDWEAYETTVDGVDGIDVAFHCFFVTADATIDGFTITGGLADGSGIHARGAGIYTDLCSPTIANCYIWGNNAVTGGGIYLSTTSNAMITRCTFEVNGAEISGGAIYVNDFVSTIITNCTFTENFVTDVLGNGGGIFNYQSDSIITNCVFSGQTILHHGGAICNNGSNPTITNCTFSENQASAGGAILNANTSSPTITNCILWGDTDLEDNPNEIHNIVPDSVPIIAYCDIQGSGGSTSWDTSLGTDGGGNIDVNPLFVGGLDYRIAAGSPAIDAADNDALPADLADLDGDEDFGEEIPYDLDDNPRLFNDPATTDSGYPPPMMPRTLTWVPTNI